MGAAAARGSDAPGERACAAGAGVWRQMEVVARARKEEAGTGAGLPERALPRCKTPEGWGESGGKNGRGERGEREDLARGGRELAGPREGEKAAGKAGEGRRGRGRAGSADGDGQLKPRDGKQEKRRRR